MNIVDRIKAHNTRLRKDADIRVMAGKADAAEVKDGRDLIVVANTARIDEDSEVVVPSGGDLGYFGENRSIFFDHCYDDDHFVGKCRRGYPVLKDGLWKVRFTVGHGEKCERLLKNAAMFGVSVSIGFDAIEHGPPTDEEIEKYGNGKSFRSIVRRWSWAELSVTWMPCNVEARSPHPAPVAEKARPRFVVLPGAVISTPRVALS